MSAAPTAQTASKSGIGSLRLEDKGKDIRLSNIVAASAVADAVRTSLGPRGMDKMIQDARGQVVITNDGATILKQMSVLHPTAKMLVELSKSQDIEAGDGTTSVVVIAGSLLRAAEQLLDKGIHPQTITDGFLMAAHKAEEILKEISIPINLTDRDALISAASTSLNSKVVAQSSDILAPLAVEAVLKVSEVGEGDIPVSVDLNDIKICSKLGGTVDDTELVDGLVMAQKVAKVAGGPNKIQNAKIGLIQFCLSPAKTDMENNVTVKDYSQMDRILREERAQLAKMVKHIAKTGCNVLLVQKSILRDAVTNLSLDFCAKAKILVVRDVERDDIDFLSRILGCEPIASLDHFTPERLGSAESVQEESLGGSGLGSIVRFSGLPKTQNRTGCVSVLLRGSTNVVIEEAERSLHDALCVVRRLVKLRALIPGGGCPEMELSVRLSQYARTVEGVHSHCIRAFAEALEVIPATLAENAGLRSIEIVTQLRSAHAAGNRHAGIDLRKGAIDMDVGKNLKVLQPLLVSLSAIKMATETVRMILKIDDLVWTK